MHASSRGFPKKTSRAPSHKRRHDSAAAIGAVQTPRLPGGTIELSLPCTDRRGGYIELDSLDSKLEVIEAALYFDANTKAAVQIVDALERLLNLERSGTPT